MAFKSNASVWCVELITLPSCLVLLDGYTVVDTIAAANCALIVLVRDSLVFRVSNVAVCRPLPF
jgi:hypothetical protein